MDRITSSVRFKSTFFLITLIAAPFLPARENFEFSLGSRVQILSDKAFRSSDKDSFEAIGNIIIIYEDGAIYGQKASIVFPTGEARVVGNVRYIGPTATFYGSEFFYNFHTREFRLKNARIVSDNHIILGKELTRTKEGVITGEDAEYTTCKDCPESWSIIGRKIHITLGEYVRIWNAYLRVKGVVSLYIPYIIFPIKKKRQTGLLFPKFGFNFDEGTHYRQPWFLTLGDHADLTLTPSFLGKRGFANEFQFRKVWGQQQWFTFNSLQSWDRLYVPDYDNIKPTPQKTFRHLSSYEHHYTDGRHFNHHAHYSHLGDLDTVADFYFYGRDKILSPESGGGSFGEFHNDLFAITLEGYFNRNLLYPKSRQFDHRFVQILPEINVSIPPVQLLKIDWGGPDAIFLGFDGDFTHFRQNQYNEKRFIRNAFRTNLAPYLRWNIATIGPMQINSKAKWDYQHYTFPRQQHKSFTKRGAVFETEAKLRIEKIFGVAFREKVPFERIKLKEKRKKESEASALIGNLPSFNPVQAEKSYTMTKNSYKHKQEVKLKHYFLNDQLTTGNKRWEKQIHDEAAQFDSIDALREKEHTINTLVARTSLPLSNTIELQWNNSIIRKTAQWENLGGDDRSLREDFVYKRVAWFNVGQGYDLNVKTDKFRNKLTRLHITTGFDWRSGRIRASEYYFYDSRKHIVALEGNQKIGQGTFGLRFSYDPFTSPNYEQLMLHGSVQISDLLSLQALYDYNIEHKRADEKLYRLMYSPPNNCWKLDLAYHKTIIDERISLNVLINFNENSFKSLSNL